MSTPSYSSAFDNGAIIQGISSAPEFTLLPPSFLHHFLSLTTANNHHHHRDDSGVVWNLPRLHSWTGHTRPGRSYNTFGDYDLWSAGARWTKTLFTSLVRQPRSERIRRRSGGKFCLLLWASATILIKREFMSCQGLNWINTLHVRR